jgi:hypothetical protein
MPLDLLTGDSARRFPALRVHKTQKPGAKDAPGSALQSASKCQRDTWSKVVVAGVWAHSREPALVARPVHTAPCMHVAFAALNVRAAPSTREGSP